MCVSSIVDTSSFVAPSQLKNHPVEAEWLRAMLCGDYRLASTVLKHSPERLRIITTMICFMLETMRLYNSYLWGVSTTTYATGSCASRHLQLDYNAYVLQLHYTRGHQRLSRAAICYFGLTE